jgi:hypothetical protein
MCDVGNAVMARSSATPATSAISSTLPKAPSAITDATDATIGDVYARRRKARPVRQKRGARIGTQAGEDPDGQLTGYLLAGYRRIEQHAH